MIATLHAADYFQLGAAVFTALAAFAAWATVAQAARDRRNSQRPVLHMELVTRLPSGDTFVNVFNEGGTAKLVRFIVLGEGVMCLGNVPPTAVLRRGEHRQIKLGLKSMDDEPIAMVVGIDLNNRFVYARISNGTEHRWRVHRRFPWGKQPTRNMDDMLRSFFPDAGDVLALTTTPYWLVPLDDTMGVGAMSTDLV